MSETGLDLTETPFVLPPDAKLLPLSELSPRLRARIGPVDNGHSVVTRPGFRIISRLISSPLADLLGEFREPCLLTDGVLRFSRARGQDPLATLEIAFDSLATLVEARILVPSDSPEAKAAEPGYGAGQTIAGYEVEALIRSLEDTEVYRVRQPSGEPAALKIARWERHNEMLAKEIEVLDRLGGADSPRLIRNGFENGRAYFTMDWCDGVSVTTAAQRARASRDWPRLHALVAALLDAYARLHAGGTLHGDIHPGNCLATEDGRIVLLDFEKARPTTSDGTRFDLSRAGIPHFHDPAMAAAIVAGQPPPAATPASEQYAIAVLGYLLLTGEHPVRTDAEHGELLRRIVDHEPLPFTARGVAAWPSVEAVIGRALAKDPERRYPSVAAFADAFRSTSRRPLMPHHSPRPSNPALEAAIERVFALSPLPGEALHLAWLALRAAVARKDVELLAACDLLLEQAPSSCATSMVAARVARARSDSAKEAEIVRRFLVEARLRVDPIATLLATADILEGAAFRRLDVSALAGWANRRLSNLWRETEGVSSPQAASVTYAALALAETGLVALPSGVLSRLEALQATGQIDVWLGALAHDVLGEQRFAAAALAAARPECPIEHGFALLRLYRLTGDPQFVVDAQRLAAMTASEGSAGLEQFQEKRVPVLRPELRKDREAEHFGDSRKDGNALMAALLLIELERPEQAHLPYFFLRGSGE